MHRIAALFSLLLAVSLVCACAKELSGGGNSPTDAYKKLFAAVKARDTESIKSVLTKKTHDLAKMQSSRSGTPIEGVYENGFTETTFASELPTIRDERISGNMGAVEVWNSQKSSWEDLPFMNEDGFWKLAIGDTFAGTYKSPGKGRSEIEKEAANVMAAQNTYANTNANTMKPKTITVPAPPPPAKK